MAIRTWEEIKQQGSAHYKTGDTEPIDLYKSLGILKDFAIASIIKYASRNSAFDDPVSIRDMRKIQHYCDILICVFGYDDKEE